MKWLARGKTRPHRDFNLRSHIRQDITGCGIDAPIEMYEVLTRRSDPQAQGAGRIRLRCVEHMENERRLAGIGAAFMVTWDPMASMGEGRV